MGGREYFLPLYRQLATFRERISGINTTISHHRFYFMPVPSMEKQVRILSMPSPILFPVETFLQAQLIHGEQRRSYNSYEGDSDGDDDEARDTRDRRSAFLRALESNEGRKSNADRRSEASTGNQKKTSHTYGHRKEGENNVSHRKRNDRVGSRTAMPSNLKKLTLDEFFADLEKTNTNESSKELVTRRKSRARTTSKDKQLDTTFTHPWKDRGVRESRLRNRDTPKAGVLSFFDEVNAVMERKKEELRRPTKTKAHFSGTNFSSSCLSNTPSKSGAIPFCQENKNSLHYNCSDESWRGYNELLDEIMENPKFSARFHSKKQQFTFDDDVEKARQTGEVVEWLRSEKPSVETSLPTLDFALTGERSVRDDEAEVKDDGNADGILSVPSEKNASRSREFRKELKAQKNLFLKKSNWTKKQYDVTTGALVVMGSLCAKKCDAAPLDIAWSKLKELGYPMNNKNVLHNYLYVASTFSLPKPKSYAANYLDIFGDETKNNDNTGSDKSSMSIPQMLNGTESSGDINIVDEIDTSAEVALCHDFLYEATEQSTGIYVRRLVRLGKAIEAERILDTTTSSDDFRLRTYAPIYQAYLDQGDVSSTLKLFVKMKEKQNVILQTETYVQLIASIAENGFFRKESGEIDGIEELPYAKKCGPELLDILTAELAEHTIEISSASAKRLYNAFQRGFQGENPKMNLKQLHLFESLQKNIERADPDELIVSRVQLEESTGKCPRSGVQMRLINLDSIQKKRFQEGLLYLISSSHQERHPNARKTHVAEKLEKFGKWLQTRDGKPFTAILDGPNIAYYMQNFQQGTFNFHQIKFVVDALENMGENVLVVLPKKYTHDRFSIQKNNQIVKQALSVEEKHIRDDLIAKGKTFIVPVGSLDDYYWMYASVSMNEKFVPPDNKEGRWPGNRPMLISNDKLRDHKMSLLEPRLFRRWYSNFLVNFTFSAFVNDECTDKEIGFKTADFYSREIQGNSSNGNETTWHFPVSDWGENESLCIRIPS